MSDEEQGNDGVRDYSQRPSAMRKGPARVKPPVRFSVDTNIQQQPARVGSHVTYSGNGGSGYSTVSNPMNIHLEKEQQEQQAQQAQQAQQQQQAAHQRFVTPPRQQPQQPQQPQQLPQQPQRQGDGSRELDDLARDSNEVFIRRPGRGRSSTSAGIRGRGFFLMGTAKPQQLVDDSIMGTKILQRQHEEKEELTVFATIDPDDAHNVKFPSQSASILVIFIMLTISAMAAVLMYEILTARIREKPEFYNHTLSVSVKGVYCNFTYYKPEYCDAKNIQRIGCEEGCKIKDCNLPITHKWSQLSGEFLGNNSWWIYTFATANGEDYWVTGFAVPLTGWNETTQNITGEHTITDACLGPPYSHIAIIGCLSKDPYVKEYKNGHARTYRYFPKQLCVDTWGTCVRTMNTAKTAPFCKDGKWIGNDYVSTWPSPYWETTPLPVDDDTFVFPDEG